MRLRPRLGVLLTVSVPPVKVTPAFFHLLHVGNSQEERNRPERQIALTSKLQETQLKLAVADRTKPEVEIWRRPKKSTF